jgi:pimeloyl-ACP methyl ester carboxylesterase
MPTAKLGDVELYYEITGKGTPLVWSHEFGGDYRSWEPQVRYFARRYQVVTYNHRGYPPSSVPKGAANYSQGHLVDDLHRLLEHLGLGPVHLAGCSMGANMARDFALAHPAMLRSLIMVGAGAGAVNREQFLAGQAAIADGLEREGQAHRVRGFESLTTRTSFKAKDPRGFAEFKAMLAEHSAKGAANTQLGVQRERPSILELEDRLTKLDVPMLVVTGDEDWPCLLPGVFIKRTCPSAALLVVPNSGHAINIEEPAAFNAALADFLAQVDSGRWPMRDPRAVSQSITGMTK